MSAGVTPTADSLATQVRDALRVLDSVAGRLEAERLMGSACDVRDSAEVLASEIARLRGLLGAESSAAAVDGADKPARAADGHHEAVGERQGRQPSPSSTEAYDRVEDERLPLRAAFYRVQDRAEAAEQDNERLRDNAELGQQVFEETMERCERAEARVTELERALEEIRDTAKWYGQGERLQHEVHHALVVEVYSVADDALDRAVLGSTEAGSLSSRPHQEPPA